MARETTLVLVKPDGMERRLAGEILARLERRGLELKGARLLKVSKAMGREHYAEHTGKPFFKGLVDFISSGPVLALAVSGESAISVVRTMMGTTNPLDSAPGTIRGDFALELSENIVHGSDSKASATTRARAVLPRRSCLNSDYVARNRELWTKTNAEYTDDECPRCVGRGRDHVGCVRRARGRRRVLGDVDGLDVVELGCGTAYFSAWLAKRGGRPVGVDVTPAQLDTARRVMAETGIEFPLVEASAEDVPLPDASFDLVVSEYGASLWCDPERWVPEAARLLRPDGRLVFLTNSMLAILCVPDEPGYTTEQLLRPQKGLHRITWSFEDGVEFFRRPRRVDRSPPLVRLRGRAPRRALRARRREDARVLRRRDGRVGEQVACGGLVGSAQARLTLASTSPQRRAILEQLGIPFDVVEPTYVEQNVPGVEPAELVRAHAEGKAHSAHREGRVTLGVDTTVALDGRVYGKPADVEDATRMLRDLAGRTHMVVSGVCLLGPDVDVTAHEVTGVTFRALTARLLTMYLESREWEGRAGGVRDPGSRRQTGRANRR